MTELRNDARWSSKGVTNTGDESGPVGGDAALLVNSDSDVSIALLVYLSCARSIESRGSSMSMLFLRRCLEEAVA